MPGGACWSGEVEGEVMAYRPQGGSRGGAIASAGVGAREVSPTTVRRCLQKADPSSDWERHLGAFCLGRGSSPRQD